MKEMLGMTVKEAVRKLEAEKIDFVYKAESKEICGYIMIGKLWGPHWELDIMDGIVDEVEYIDYE